MGKEPSPEKQLDDLQLTLDIKTSFLDFSGDFIVACDTDLRPVYIYPAAHRLSGCSREEIGLCLSPELVHNAEDAAWVRRAMAEAIQQGSSMGESILITKNGEKINVQQNFFAIYTTQGETVGRGLIIRDISELRATQRDVRTKSALIESSVNFIAATDENLNCIYATLASIP